MTGEWLKLEAFLEAFEHGYLRAVPRSSDRTILLGHLRKIIRDYDRLYGSYRGLKSVLADLGTEEPSVSSVPLSDEAQLAIAKALQQLIIRAMVLKSLCQMATAGRPRGSKIDPETDLWLAVRAADILRNAPVGSKPTRAGAIRLAIGDMRKELGIKLTSMTSTEGHERRIRRTLTAYAELIELTPDLRTVDYTQWIRPPQQF